MRHNALHMCATLSLQNSKIQCQKITNKTSVFTDIISMSKIMSGAIHSSKYSCKIIVTITSISLSDSFIKHRQDIS